MAIYSTLRKYTLQTIQKLSARMTKNSLVYAGNGYKYDGLNMF